MSTPNVPTLSPDTGLQADISVSDLGALMGGVETPAAVAIPPAAPVTPAPAVPAVAAPEPTEAIAETPAVEPDKTIETPPEGDAPKLETETPVKKDKEKWWDKRLSHSAEKRREAEARADTLQRELEALRAQPGPTPAATATVTTPAPKATGKPELASFVAALKDGETYESAVEKYTDASSEFREKARDTARAAQVQADQTKVQQTQFSKDWAAALVVHPDFQDVVERVRAAAPEGLQVAVSQIQDETGKALWPDLTLYLDEHPAELTAISAQFATNPYAAAAKLGRIAASFSTPVAPPAPTTKTQTAPKISPKPPTAVGGNAAPGVVDLNDPKTSMDVAAREFAKLGL